MSSLKGVSPVKFHLVINALTAYMTLLNAGHTLDDFGFEWMEPHLTAPHMLFKSTDEEVDLVGRTLRATADRLHLQLISREALLTQLRAYLAEMQAAMKLVRLDVEPF